MADVLFLIKANRVQEYHHQNLAIMAAPDGDRFEISYGERWVAPDLDVQPGQGCALVIADSPYRHYRPLRWGMIEEAEFADRRLRLMVRLGSFILDGERITRRWDADALLDSQRGDGAKTRPYFVFSEPNDGMRNPHGPSEQDDAWRAAISGLADNEYFAGCSVARMGDVTRADGVALDPGQAVPVGTEVRLRFEVRSIGRSEETLDVALESDPPGSIELLEPAVVSADGEAEVTAVLTSPGPVRARLNFLPDALRSSRPTASFTVTGTPTQPDGPAMQGTSPVDGVRRLVRRLQREADIGDVAWIGLFEDFFVPWGGNDLEVVAGYAERLFEAGRHLDVEHVLAKVERRSPRLDLLLLLAAIHNGTASAHDGLLVGVDLEDAGHFALLLRALDAAPAVALRPVVEPLFKNVLGDVRKLELIRHVLPRVPSDEFATVLAEEIAYNDPELGVGLMMNRWPDPADIHGPALDLLVDFGVRKNQLGPYVRHWLGSMAQAHQWEAIIEGLSKARQALAIADRPSTFAAIAADLLGSGDRDAARAGFELACDAANEACRTGQMDTASTLADVLRGNLSVGGSEEHRLAARAIIDSIDEALTQSDELIDWRRKQAEDRFSLLEPHCRGKVLHLVGGLVDAWEADLVAKLGLSKLDRHEAEKTKSPTADWADSTNPDEDIVVIIWERMGHALSNRVKDACRRRSVVWIEARTGQRGLLDALESKFTH